MLIGREIMLSAGDAAVSAAVGGRGRLVLVGGEAGIGKTALSMAIAERGVAAGMVLRIGACWEAEGLPPFTPWLEVLRRPGGDMASDVAMRLESGDPAVVTDADAARRARSRVFSEVVDALRLASEERPQLLLLEDLHWADVPSLELLAAVAAHLPSMAVLVVATFRDDELPRDNPLASIGGNAEHLNLEGLEVAGVAGLLDDVLHRPLAAGEAEAVMRQTAGNPLFVIQVARLIAVGSRNLPAGVRNVLGRRLARLSSDCDRVLGAASAIGHEFDYATLAEMLGADPLPALDEAAAAGLVAIGDEPMRWRFVHSIVQTTRYEALSTGEREEWHRRAVLALRLRPFTPAATLAHHALRGRFAADDPVVAELLIAAGREALARFAWADASRAFGRAVSAAPEGLAGEEARVEAWLGTGAARLRTDGGNVRSAFDEAVVLARRMGRPDLVARAALGFSVGLGAFEVRLLDRRQIDLLEEAAGGLPADAPLLPLVLARLSVALAFLDSDERRVELATRAVQLARAAGEPVALGYALAAMCDARSGPAHVAERRAACEEIIQLGRRADDLPLELLGRRLRVVALMESNDFEEVDTEISAYDRSASVLGDPLYRWYSLLWRAARAWNRGELAEADELARQAVRVGAEGGSVNSAVLDAVHRLLTGIDRRDRFAVEGARTALLALLPETISMYNWFNTAYVEANLGEFDRARAAIDQVDANALASLPRDSEWVPSLTQIASAAARSGHRRMAELALSHLEPISAVGSVEGIGAFCNGSSHRFAALATSLMGDRDATRRHVDAAEVAVRGAGALLEAVTALDGAWALRTAADPEDALRATAMAVKSAAALRRIGLPVLAAEAEALAHSVPDSPLPDPVPAPSAPPPLTAEQAAAGTACLVREGDTWAWTWAGTTTNVRHAKGVADLALLLKRSGSEVHVRELEGASATSAGRPSNAAVLDETAVRQYRRRLEDLEDELDEADRHADVGRAEKLSAERDALVDQLTKAFGIGGRTRQLGNDPDERLRKAVSARVKATIERIEAIHPALGRHLRASVITGFWCCYRPEQAIAWTISHDR